MGSSTSFGGERSPAGMRHRKGTLAEAIDDLRSDIDSAFLLLEETAEGGALAYNYISMSVNPSDTNTITIGSDVYEFVGDANTANETNIAVDIGGDAATTRNSLIAAINATYASTHPTLLTASGDPAPANGTENVLATAEGANLNIRTADAPGGTPTATGEDIATSASLTSTEVWLFDNLNEVGKAAGVSQRATLEYTFSANVITQDWASWLFPFTVAGFMVQVRSSTGVVKYVTDTFTSSGDNINWGSAGVTNVAATDVLTIIAWS